MHSEALIYGSLIAVGIIFLSANFMLFSIKFEVDDMWETLDSEVANVMVMSGNLQEELAAMPRIENRKRRQSYYDGGQSYQQKVSAAVEARPPSISPSCNCDIQQQNNCPAGPPGSRGNPGAAGIPGPNGNPGQPGADTTDLQLYHVDNGCQYCPIGQQGPDGRPGVQGPRGPRGQNGMSGNHGNSGMPGRNGDMGSPGGEGPTGSPGLIGRLGNNGTKIVGTRGNPGAPGEPGIRGLAGEKGLDGTNGLPGPIGPRGESGNPGRNGKQGEPGEQGQRGDPGYDGLYCPCPRRAYSTEPPSYPPAPITGY